MAGIREPGWTLGGMAALTGIGPAVWGMWHLKRWALILSWVLAGCALALGLYWVHFAWTFWLFDEPTFLDRVRAELNPIILLWWVTPSAWLWYFTRPSVTTHFTSAWGQTPPQDMGWGSDPSTRCG
jgi:hypothetical protein